MRVVFVHGACVRTGSWWWHRTGAALDQRGVASVTPLLPSCGEGGVPAGSDGPGLSDDVAAVRAVLQDSSEATVVVAHSYGGIVTAEAAAGVAAVAHLVLVSSYLPEVGQHLSSFAGPDPAPFLDVDPVTGTFGVRPDSFADLFLHDCPDVADEAARHLARQSLSVVDQGVRAAAWQQTPTTYVVCTEDRGTPVQAQQEFARRAGTVVELRAGHHPFLSQPQIMAELVAGLA